LQMFMGEKFGRDPIWENHLATEIGQAEIAVEAVLYEAKLPLRELMRLDVGDTLTLEIKPDANVAVRCGDVILTEGRMGRVGDRVAVRVGKPLRKPRTTLAMFEGTDVATTAAPPNRREVP
jgi:flagellar motor switch protein FliM